MRRIGLIVLIAFIGSQQVSAQDPSQIDPSQIRPGNRSGKEVFETICITCHGPDGKGKVNAALLKSITPPDFTDCQFAAREADIDWIAVAHRGGPARGFSPLMASWQGSFSSDELARAVGHLRTFCTDDRWPRGELNLPRPLVTGKAFPEDEIVVTNATAAEGSGQVVNKFIYERRIGPLNQVEISIPMSWSERADGAWQSGVGDIALGYKRTLTHSLQRGNILSVSAEVVLPTGSERKGAGGGKTVFEPFVTFAQLLPANGFIQTQAGLEIPSGDHDTEGFVRAALGTSINPDRFGRTWSPMIEVLAARAFANGAEIDWDVVPQMQITLNARQHVRINGGVRLPVNRRAERSTTVMLYLLWDWFDGGFFEGW